MQKALMVGLSKTLTSQSHLSARSLNFFVCGSRSRAMRRTRMVRLVEQLALLEGLTRHLVVLNEGRFLNRVGGDEIAEYRPARNLDALAVLSGKRRRQDRAGKRDNQERHPAP
jgi:hypothetical protein